MFYCMRCSQPLLTEIRSSGVQVILHFEGGVTRTLAVYSKQQPQQIESIEIDGPVVRITLPSNVLKESSSISLFDVLRKGAELWNLE
jgi:hypothetical protein